MGTVTLFIHCTYHAIQEPTPEPLSQKGRGGVKDHLQLHMHVKHAKGCGRWRMSQFSDLECMVISHLRKPLALMSMCN